MVKKLLIIDDDLFTVKMLEDLFREEWKVFSESILEQVVKRIQNERPGVVLLNVYLRRTEGERIFDGIKKLDPHLSVIVYSPVGQIKLGRSLLKKGAFWHLSMPLNTDDLAHAVKIALAFEEQQETTLRTRHDFDQLEKGIAKMFLPIQGSLPGRFTFEQDELTQGIIDLLADILEVDKVSLMLLNPENGEMRIKAAKGLSAYVMQNTIKKVGEGIAGWVAREGKPLLIKDVQQDSQFRESSFYHQYSTRSLICVPLKAGDRVIGVLSANNKYSGQPFNEEDLYLGMIFSHLLLLTLQNAQLHYDREKHFSRETELSGLHRKISATLEPKVLFHILLNECCSIFGAEFALLFTLDEKPGECCVYYLHGTKFIEATLPPTLFQEWISSRNGPRLVTAETESKELELVRSVLKQEIRSWVSVPIVIQDKLNGSLEMASFDPARFREADKQALARIGQQASLAVSNAHLYAKLLNSIKEISEARKEVERVRRNQFL